MHLQKESHVIWHKVHSGEQHERQFSLAACSLASASLSTCVAYGLNCLAITTRRQATHQMLIGVTSTYTLTSCKARHAQSTFVMLKACFALRFIVCRSTRRMKGQQQSSSGRKLPPTNSSSSNNNKSKNSEARLLS